MTLVKVSLLALIVFNKGARSTLCRGLQSGGLIGYCIEYYDVSQHQACENADMTVEGAIAGDCQGIADVQPLYAPVNAKHKGRLLYPQLGGNRKLLQRRSHRPGIGGILL